MRTTPHHAATTPHFLSRDAQTQTQTSALHPFLSLTASGLEMSIGSYEPRKHVWLEIIVAANGIVMKENFATGFRCLGKWKKTEGADLQC